MICKNCQAEFVASHFNQRCCGEACRTTLRKQTRRNYKKTKKGRQAESRWRQNPKKKEIDRKYYTSEKGRKNAVRRVARLLRSNPMYRERKRLNDTAAYRDLRKFLIANVGECQRCGSKDRLTIDHVTPMSKGGPHAKSNLQVLCLSCNSKKKSQVIRYAGSAEST